MMLKLRISIFKMMSLILVISSCSFLSNNPATKSEKYSFNFKAPEWSSINSKDADHAYISEKSGSILTINSLCQKYQSSSLYHLVSNMLGGIEEIEVEKKQEIDFSERKALKAWVRGKLDGVEIYLTIQTLRKNNCLYDFILISTSKEKRETDHKTFAKLLNSMKIN